MTRLFTGLIALALVWAQSAAAHDIGVSQADLVELEDKSYTLSVQAGTAVSALFAMPLLPEHCQFSGNPRGVQRPGKRTFAFSCVERLTAVDTIELPWRRDGVMLTAKWLESAEAKRLFRNEAGRIVVPLADLLAGSADWLDAAQRYTGLGIEHILLGFDHLMFVLALFLIVRGAWMLVKTITAFTVAHSVTLGLATLGFIDVPTRPVEAAIALSIVFLCVEIVHARQRRIGVTYRYPWLIAFAFGLLHGLGFAGALADIGLPPGEIPIALLFFNIGVEVGQLIFVAAVLMLVWLLRRLRLDNLARARVVPAYLIGTLAAYWFLQRFSMMIPVV